jgi:phospholipase C
LFIITFDEHGGFYDHVPTPLNVPPPGDGEKSYPLPGVLFNRLGIRIPTLLISPWVPKGKNILLQEERWQCVLVCLKFIFALAQF